MCNVSKYFSKQQRSYLKNDFICAKPWINSSIYQHKIKRLEVWNWKKFCLRKVTLDSKQGREGFKNFRYFTEPEQRFVFGTILSEVSAQLPVLKLVDLKYNKHLSTVNNFWEEKLLEGSKPYEKAVLKTNWIKKIQKLNFQETNFLFLSPPANPHKNQFFEYLLILGETATFLNQKNE